ncbi:MAG: diguanylate cyclase [Proteobacteria bacterium]|nr:diguanylate cyclase [Pseudomonadota bacterium]
MKESSSVLRDIKLVRKAEQALDKTENFLKRIKNNKLSLTLEDGVYKVNSDDMNKVTKLISDIDRSGASLADAVNIMRDLMIYDEITHMYSRRYILNVLEKELIRSKRYKSEFSLIAIEINFKDVAIMEHGSESKNLLITKIATEIKKFKRHVDSAGRTGPFTFLLILPETDLKGAEIVASRIKKDVAVDYDVFDKVVKVGVNVAIMDNKQTDLVNLVEIMYLLDSKLAESR